VKKNIVYGVVFFVLCVGIFVGSIVGMFVGETNPGESECMVLKYRTVAGRDITLDISPEVCGVFGFTHGDSVRMKRAGWEHGNKGTFIGIRHPFDSNKNELWIDFNGKHGKVSWVKPGEIDKEFEVQ
jgi:hypothetical protein